MRVEAGLLARLAAEWHGSRPALTTESGTQFVHRAERGVRTGIGSGMLGAGLSRGDRVGVFAYNRAEVVEAWLGFEKHNLVRVVLHSHFDMADATSGTLNHVEATALVFDTRLRRRGRPAPQ